MAKTYYVDGDSGSNNNSGSSEGSAKASGTAATRSTNVYTLDGSPDLSGVTANVDTIRIVGETSGNGATGDIFYITAVDGGAYQVTVSPTPTGGTSGLTWYIGGAFATIDMSFSSVIHDDIVYIKAKGSSAYYDELANIENAGAGSPNGWVTIEGYTSTPGDGSLGSAVLWKNSSGSAITDTPTNNYYHFKYIKIDSCAARGGTLANGYFWEECVFSNNSGEGMYVGSSSTFYRCRSANNANVGIYISSSYPIVAGCNVYGNANQQLNIVGSLGAVIFNKLHGPTSTLHYVVQNEADNTVFIGNTFSRASGIAETIYMGTSNPLVIVNNVFSDDNRCLYANDIVNYSHGLAGHNLLHDISASAAYYNGGTGTGDHRTYKPGFGVGDVSASAGVSVFTDAASDNYTLVAGSPAIGVGLEPVD